MPDTKTQSGRRSVGRRTEIDCGVCICRITKWTLKMMLVVLEGLDNKLRLLRLARIDNIADVVALGTSALA